MEEELILGRFEYCLNVKNIKTSLVFYKKLGFEVIDSDIEQGFAVINYEDCTLALYQGHMSTNMLNFRGGDVFKIARALKAQGLSFTEDAHVEEDGSAGAVLKDPDGNIIYFNTSPGEEIDEDLDDFDE